MREALEEGRRALPGCLPNPPVGCVLVRAGVIVGRGYTQPPGGPHAEAMALQLLNGDLSDVTAYVTLEPCSFHGRTPSCAEALIRRGVRKVVVARVDPDKRNDGKGIELLRAAGVEVIMGVLEREATIDMRPYLVSAS